MEAQQFHELAPHVGIEGVRFVHDQHFAPQSLQSQHRMAHRQHR